MWREKNWRLNGKSSYRPTHPTSTLKTCVLMSPRTRQQQPGLSLLVGVMAWVVSIPWYSVPTACLSLWGCKHTGKYEELRPPSRGISPPLQHKPIFHKEYLGISDWSTQNAGRIWECFQSLIPLHSCLFFSLSQPLRDHLQSHTDLTKLPSLLCVSSVYWDNSHSAFLGLRIFPGAHDKPWPNLLFILTTSHRQLKGGVMGQRDKPWRVFVAGCLLLSPPCSSRSESPDWEHTLFVEGSVGSPLKPSPRNVGNFLHRTCPLVKLLCFHRVTND